MQNSANQGNGKPEQLFLGGVSPHGGRLCISRYSARNDLFGISSRRENLVSRFLLTAFEKVVVLRCLEMTGDFQEKHQSGLLIGNLRHYVRNMGIRDYITQS